MIARQERNTEQQDIWARLSASLPTGTIAWRQDGRAVQREGKFFARFVAYVEANTVRERLDGIVPGEWDLTLELLPALVTDDNGDACCSFKARLQVLGVIREDVGTGRDYKQASTDAFKRAAVRFGIAHELYSYDQNWVQVDGDGKYAKPVEDPAAAYARRAKRGSRADRVESSDDSLIEPPAGAASGADEHSSSEPSCPSCGGRMWDNTLTKRNPRAPDYKCRNRSCDGVIWPARVGSTESASGEAVAEVAAVRGHGVLELEELPF